MSFNAYIQLIRPRQWVKNFFVVAPLIFGMKLLDVRALISTICAFVIFCLVASLIYVFNDLCDVKSDRQHSKNCHRPLASGVITHSSGIIFLFGWMFFTLGIATLTLKLSYLNWHFYFIVMIYLCVNLAYSLGLKHIALFEMFLVGSGYVLRVLAGCAALAVAPSPWIIVVTAVTSMFIVAGKRRAELISSVDGKKGRKSISEYNIAFLDSLIAIFGSASIITYILFTLSKQVIEQYHGSLIYSSVFVAYGVTRYILLIKVRGGAESPTDLVTTDPGIFLSVILWIAFMIVVIY